RALTIVNSMSFNDTRTNLRTKARQDNHKPNEVIKILIEQGQQHSVDLKSKGNRKGRHQSSDSTDCLGVFGGER
ncbi:17606_t:CDS:1, partial [Acaulospora colombiana]